MITTYPLPKLYDLPFYRPTEGVCQKRLTSPLKSRKKVSNKHRLCEQEAIEKFLEMSFYDLDKEYCNKLKV